jgi:RNA methyltransferase, TrmH family
MNWSTLPAPTPTEITVITSRSNPWVQQWLRYHAKPSERKSAGLAWLEGEHLVCEALTRVGSEYLQTLVLPHTATGQALYQAYLSQFAGCSQIPVMWLGESIYQALCTMDSVPKVCAVLQLPIALSAKSMSAAVVLDGVQDPGNMGTLIRLCAAFGVSHVYVSAGSASAWSAKALRAGQGAQLALTVHEDVNLSSVYEAFKQQGLAIAVTCLAPESLALQAAQLPKRMVWVFGHEGQGVSAVSMAAATQRIHIPMAGGFESLNVASAAAICLWHWQSQHLKN